MPKTREDVLDFNSSCGKTPVVLNSSKLVDAPRIARESSRERGRFTSLLREEYVTFMTRWTENFTSRTAYYTLTEYVNKNGIELLEYIYFFYHGTLTSMLSNSVSSIYFNISSMMPTAMVSPPRLKTNLPSGRQSAYFEMQIFWSKVISTVALAPPASTLGLCRFTVPSLFFVQMSLLATAGVSMECI
mmetsp:Transcript_6209/g.11805  ORF Transcript_6209/g.11805 Transcript_6209/m.11805 type:complete len:188 (-) Transcript_6209:2056-2619(-)